MPGLTCTYGNVARLDLNVPFFLRQDPFGNLQTGIGPAAERENTDYSWDPKAQMTLLVKTRTRSPKKSPSESG